MSDVAQWTANMDTLREMQLVNERMKWREQSRQEMRSIFVWLLQSAMESVGYAALNPDPAVFRMVVKGAKEQRAIIMKAWREFEATP